MIINRNLSESMINQNPFIQFDKWYTEHLKAGTAIPNTVSLGTTFPNGHVSVRTVLLKEYDESGFVFYTNYNSKKGSQLLLTNKAALLFYWPYSGRQIRIEGIAKKMTAKGSEDYFKVRPRESQIATWVSEQSSVIPDRQFLDDRYELYKNKFGGRPVERPPSWGDSVLFLIGLNSGRKEISAFMTGYHIQEKKVAGSLSALLHKYL